MYNNYNYSKFVENSTTFSLNIYVYNIQEAIFAELNGFNRSISVLIDQDRKKDKDIKELKQKIDNLQNGEYASKPHKMDESSMHLLNDKNEHADKIYESYNMRPRKAGRLIPLSLLENKY